MELSYLQLTDKQVPYYLCKIKGTDLIRMSYVARRGQSEEEGAVQRILNTRRISSISRFLQNGGFFPTNIILNIIDANKIEVSENILSVSDDYRAVRTDLHQYQYRTEECAKIVDI